MRFRSSRFPANAVLLVSGFGDDTGGGLYAVGEDGAEQLDPLSSTGLATADGQLVRLLRASLEPGYGSELLVYDERGVVRYLRLDEVDDPHDVVWHGEHYVVVSTTQNAILWVTPAGRIARRWAAPGNGDAWHLNSLTTVNGDLLAAAFGRFDRHRAWTESETRGAGLVFDVGSGRVVLDGLSRPHHPRLINGTWLVCNSQDRELLELNRAGVPLRRLRLRGWTRGIESSGRFLFVGESAGRDGFAGPARASVALVSRRSWRIVDRIELPCREVYDLLFVPPALLEGVRRGFRTNPLRTAEQAQHELFSAVGTRPARLWVTGEPLPAESCRVRIESTVPDTLRPGSLNRLECTVSNRGSAILASVPPNPVNVSYRWLGGPPGIAPEEGLRLPLPEPLPPGATARCRVTVKAPDTPGDYVLKITLVQEQVRWFDEVEAANSWTARIGVR